MASEAKGKSKLVLACYNETNACRQKEKGCTQCRELPLCAGFGEGCQWQALPSPVQCEKTATRTRDLPVTGGKTLPLALGPSFGEWWPNHLKISQLFWQNKKHWYLFQKKKSSGAVLLGTLFSVFHNKKLCCSLFLIVDSAFTLLD